MKELEHQVRSITSYVESQARDETVTHAERMIRAKVMGHEHEVWDCPDHQDRYWVVTNMTNLSNQDEFKSADYALSFHLGLMVRMMERDRSDPDPEIADTSPLSWRKHEQAVEAFNRAGEAEEFQSVGVHCREALIALGNDLAKALSLQGDDLPKAADFKGWADLAAENWATERRLRAYLKSLSTHAWDLSVWLQHHGNATPGCGSCLSRPRTTPWSRGSRKFADHRERHPGARVAVRIASRAMAGLSTTMTLTSNGSSKSVAPASTNGIDTLFTWCPGRVGHGPIGFRLKASEV